MPAFLRYFDAVHRRAMRDVAALPAIADGWAPPMGEGGHGWSINVLAVNLTTWNRLEPRVQQFLLEQVKAYEDKMWQTLKAADAQADNCNFNKPPCTMGRLANMTLVPVKPEEAAVHKRLVETAVLANWAKRCGAACAREWNDTVGKTLGLTAPNP